MITAYENCEKTAKPFHINAEIAIKRIKEGNSKVKIEMLRLATTKESREKIKKSLPCYSWSGTFEYRSDGRLLKHSGLVCLDFDHLGDRLDAFKKWVCGRPYTHVAFISPSGDGLKVVIRIPANKDTHKRSCEAITQYFSDESLDSFTDVSRLCFESHDPEIYYNPTSERFDKLADEPKQVEPIHIASALTDYDQIYNNLKKWKEKKDTYKDGEKHWFLVSLAGACNRFGVPQDVTLNKLLYDYLNAASPVDPADYEAIVNKVYKNYRHEHATRFFDNLHVAKNNDESPADEKVFDLTLPAKDIIYLDSIRDKMMAGFYNGYTKGTTTYFKTIDPHFTWLIGDVILMVGIMNHGKSQMMMALALMKSIKEGVKWGVFSPEQDPPDYFYNDLIHTLIGENVDPFFRNQTPIGTYKQGMDFVNEHFFYISPENDMPTPEYINERFEELIVKHKIGGCITDPFNQLDHDWSKHGRDDKYISEYLKKEKRFALKHQVYKVIIAHPNSDFKKKADGNYPCPDVFDIAGGAMWGNKCDEVLATYRPYYSTDKASTEVQFVSHKIKKQKIVGIPGEVTMTFDRVTNRFLENGISPLESKQATVNCNPDSFIESKRTEVSDPKDMPF